MFRMSDRYPAGPAARARFDTFASSHPDRVTVVAKMDGFTHAWLQLAGKAQSEIAGGADVAAVERSVAVEIQKLKSRAVEAMRAAYAEALESAIAGARDRGAHDQVSALMNERDPHFVLDLDSDEMTLSLHPALGPHVDRIVGALATDAVR
jgi:hypothetical protein